MFDHVEAYYRPGSIPEALRLFQTGNGGARFLAGGTDLINQADNSVRSLIDVTNLGLNYIRRQDGGWIIGATTTLSDLESSAATRAVADGILLKAASLSGPVQTRNMATAGGRLAQRSQFAEIATPLVALDASVLMAHSRRRLKLPLTDLAAVHSDVLMHGAMILEIVIPALPAGGHTGWSFQKLTRTESDVSLVNVAAGLQVGRNGSCEWVHIAVGAVGPVPVRAIQAENQLTGRTIDATLLDIASDAVMNAVKPVDGIRGSAEYLREMTRVMARRALVECAEHAGCTL
jgi:CO/xanthine dehydrogenase FAD-binding subunit